MCFVMFLENNKFNEWVSTYAETNVKPFKIEKLGGKAL